MKGIMFKEDLFNAVIEGRKTQTRRIAKIDHSLDLIGKGITGYTSFEDRKTLDIYSIYPRYNKGETIYLKEPYFITKDIVTYRYLNDKWDIYPKGYWKNKMFMAEKYARYFIKITNVRIERLHDISENDAKAEGVGYGFQMNAGYPDYTKIKDGICTLTQDTASVSFGTLWESINGKDSWDSNPWVWIYEFELTQ